MTTDEKKEGAETTELEPEANLAAQASQVEAEAEASEAKAPEEPASEADAPEKTEEAPVEAVEPAGGGVRAPLGSQEDVAQAVAAAEALMAGDEPNAGVEAEGTEEAKAERAEKEPDDGRRWYVVHCYSGYENKVRHNLEQRIETMGMKDKIFDVVVPTEEEIEVKDGKRRTVERRVFPGYILVQMIMDEDSWYVVRNTPGVTGFVGMGNEPTPLRPEEVAQIIKRMEAEAPRIKVTFKIGEKVRIIDGPFNDFIGTVESIDMERAKVRVMVSFFGRETPVELDFLQVEKA